MSKMNPYWKEKWLKALRSGEYQQGVSKLHSVAYGSEYFCCLGVLCDIYQKETGDLVRLEHQTSGGTWEYAYASKTENDSIIYEDADPDYLPEYLQKIMNLSRSGAVTFTNIDGDEIDTSLADLNDDGTTFDDIANVIEENL